MKTRLLFCILFFTAIMSYGQEITLDTEITNDLDGVTLPNGTIDQYWYWSHGIDVVTGTGFTPNSTVTAFATDPEGTKWRDYTATTDAQGGFTIKQMSAKKNRSVLGEHTITAKDEQGNTATAILTVVANRRETITATVDRPQLTMSEFAGEGFNINASGYAPEAEVTIHVSSPSSYTTSLTGGPFYSDINGNFSCNINLYSDWQLPDTPGEWSVNVTEMTSKSPYAIVKVRIWPDNPTPDNYCTIEQNSGSVVAPITSFEVENVKSNTSSAEATEYYEDFTDVVFDVNAGETYKVKLKGKNGVSYSADTYTLFADWNQNGVLDEEGEVIQEGFIFGSTGEDDIFTEFDLTIPKHAVSGNTRLRILKVSSSTSVSMFWPTGACGSYWSRGQVEDYTLNIVGGSTLPDCKLERMESIIRTAENDDDFVVIDYDVAVECQPKEGFFCELNYGSGLEKGVLNSNYRYAQNDFVLPDGAVSKITKVRATVGTYVSQSVLRFYEDNNGVPGDLIKAFEAIDHSATQTSVGTLNGLPAYDAEMTLPEALELSGGTYWLGIQTYGPMAYMATTSEITGYQTYVDGVEQDGHDGVFSIVYECDGSGDTEARLVGGLPSGAEFPVGTTPVRYNLYYQNMFVDYCTFMVIVHPTPPTECSIICPENIEVTTEEATAKVTYDIDHQCATGAAQTELKLVAGLASGADFPVGTTTVTYNLTFNGNTLDVCSFDVTVKNPEPVNCSILCPDNITVQAAAGATAAAVNYTIDHLCEEGTILTELKRISGPASGADFPIGTTTVTYNLVFNDEILDVCSFNVTVEPGVGIEGFGETTLKVYPNPVTDILNIDNEQDITIVSVYDLAGRKVMEKKIDAKTAQLNLSSLSKGAYIIKVEMVGSVKSIIVNK